MNEITSGEEIRRLDLHVRKLKQRSFHRLGESNSELVGQSAANTIREELLGKRKSSE